MRSLALIGLAACWSSSPSKPEPAKPTDARPAPIATASAPPATPTPAPSKPAPPPAPPYRIPAAVADALAAERLAGNVLVPYGVALYPTLAAARADSAKRTSGVPSAMRVVRDHGDVVELATARVDDCADSYAPPYDLTVFVRRDKLFPRTKVEVVKAFGDGTAVAIDRGAGVDVSDRGLVWESRALAETKVAPSADQLTYAVPAKLPAAQLPARTGERLVCDKAGPQTLAEWREDRRRTREAERERAQARAIAEAEARRARLERERAERDAKRKADAAKRAKPKQGAGTFSEQDIADFADRLTTYDSDIDLARQGALFDMESDERYLRWCGVTDTRYLASSQTPPPKLDGVEVSWPSSQYSHRTRNDQVVKDGPRYLGDVGYRCGRVRLAVGASGVGSTGGGAGMIGGGGQVKVWIPRPGPVTWPDGTPAGKYTGGKRYRDVVEQGDRICVHVRDIAELVCHEKKTAKTEMSYRFDLD